MARKRGAGEGTFWKRSGRWYGKRRIGPREAVVTVNASGATRAEAVANLRKEVERLQRDADAPIDATASLAVYLAWWVDVELAQRVADGVIVETTRKQYADRVRFQIAPLLGDVRLQDLTAMRIRQWMAKLDRKGASPSLRRHALAVLKNALEYAVRYEVLPGNPARLVEPPAVHRKRRAEITPATAKARSQSQPRSSPSGPPSRRPHCRFRTGALCGTRSWTSLPSASRSGSRNALSPSRAHRRTGRGHIADDGEHTARRTITSGLTAGQRDGRPSRMLAAGM